MFGTRLEEVRTARNLTQTELSQLSGVDQSTISLYETHKRQPGLPILHKLAGALKCQVSDLLAAPGSPIPVPAPKQPAAVA